MVLRIRRIKKLAPLIFTSLLSLIVLFRVYRQYPFSDHFETRREDDRSGNVHCFSRLRQIEEYEKPELTSKFYEPNRWKSFISYVTRSRKDVKTVSRSLSNLDLYQKCSKEIRADQDISLLHSIETKLFPYINFTALNSEQSHNFGLFIPALMEQSTVDRYYNFLLRTIRSLELHPLNSRLANLFGRTG